MNECLHPVKRTVSLFLAVMIVGIIFSSCGKIPRDTPYTFRVENDASGEMQWSVKLSDSRVVSYELRAAEGGQTDVVFTGLKKGSTDATLYLAPQGGYPEDSDNVYVLTLKVDARKNVTQPEPYYGAYAVRLKGDVAGAQWHIELSDEQVVHWKEDREYPKKSTDEDGMQDFTQIYTFTGRHPGATHVRIRVSYPWAEGADSTREDFWLLVDDEYRVSVLEPTDFVSFRLSEQDTSAIHDVYEATRTESGVRLSHYHATNSWSDETNDFAETKLDEGVIDGGESLYMYLAGLVQACGVPEWDGFKKSNSHVLDGTMFSFEAELADGTRISASGSNAYPNHYRDFKMSVIAVAPKPVPEPV